MRQKTERHQDAPEHKINCADVIDVLMESFILPGVPVFIRSDNGPDFVVEPLCNCTKSEPKPASSNPDHPGRIVAPRALVRGFETTCSMRRSSAA